MSQISSIIKHVQLDHLKYLPFSDKEVSLVGQGRKDFHCSVTSMPTSLFQLQPSQPTSLRSTCIQSHLFIMNDFDWLNSKSCFLVLFCFFTRVLIMKLKLSVITCIICYKEIKYNLHFNKLHLYCTMDTIKLDLTHIMRRLQ